MKKQILISMSVMMFLILILNVIALDSRAGLISDSRVGSGLDSRRTIPTHEITYPSLSLSSDITDCGEIDSSGYYSLSTNLYATDSCILITADNVILDGNGYNIYFNSGDTDSQSGIQVGYNQNITIENFYLISDLAETSENNNGIYLSGSLTTTIFNNSLTNNYLSSSISGNNLITLDTTTAVNISNNHFYNYDSSLYSYDIHAFSSISPNILNNNLYSVNSGIFDENNYFTLIKGNNIWTDNGDGIDLNFPEYCAVEKNIINSVGVGVAMSYSSFQVEIKDNYINSTGEMALYIGSSGDDSYGDSIENNTLISPYDDFYLYNPSVYNMILKNQYVTNYYILNLANMVFMTNETRIEFQQINGVDSNLSSDIKMKNNYAYVNDSKNNLNVSANISFIGGSQSGLFGYNHFLSMTDLTILGNTDYTRSAWIKLPSGSVDARQEVDYLGQEGNTGYFTGMYVISHKFCCDEWGSGYGDPYCSTANVDTGDWVYVACSYNGSFIQTYVNGYADGDPNPFTDSDIHRGYASIGSAYTNLLNFNGNIDEYKIFNVALSPSEILDDYNKKSVCGSPESNLVTAYNFNNNLNDYSGYGNDGINHGLTFDSNNISDCSGNPIWLNYSNPFIAKDGKLCLDCINYTSLNDKNVIFSVTSWSNYSIMDSSPSPSPSPSTSISPSPTSSPSPSTSISPSPTSSPSPSSSLTINPTFFTIDFNQPINLILIILLFIVILILCYIRLFVQAGFLALILGFILLFSNVNILLSFICIAIGVVIIFVFKRK